MLRRLAIQNYALIDSLDIEFPGGLIIITGETGAGKSIMMGALSLLLGAKADVSALKDNARNCVVEGEFDVDGEEFILRRVISPAGRTRNFINDEPATLASLTEIASRIVDALTGPATSATATFDDVAVVGAACILAITVSAASSTILYAISS